MWNRKSKAYPNDHQGMTSFRKPVMASDIVKNNMICRESVVCWNATIYSLESSCSNKAIPKRAQTERHPRVLKLNCVICRISLEELFEQQLRRKHSFPSPAKNYCCFNYDADGAPVCFSQQFLYPFHRSIESNCSQIGWKWNWQRWPWSGEVSPKCWCQRKTRSKSWKVAINFI